MMMMATGGPGLVSPLEFGQTRKPMPKWLFGAVAASVLIHGAAGVWLYNQRFEMPVIETPPESKPIDTILWQRPKPPSPPVAQKTAPQTPVHDPIITTQPRVTIPLTPPDVIPTEIAVGSLVSTTPSSAPSEAGTTNAVEAPTAPAVITRPEWIQKPTGAQLLDVYPNRALDKGVAGSATLRCTVTAAGRLSGCSVASETPGGYGFGRAAMSLTRYFAVSPRLVDGRPVAGAEVDIPIRFNAG
ncbi:TonB family protein [Brevundimonas sp.]|uniref:energy transducer TonB family protein n=1 Tax=Brevundimonas sp. TaxID=1871086 RepID=UPI0035AFC2FC